ncbi:La-related protein 6 [Hordeum vulgare]|nr:La-related protein 6 [Hordeum vulgare]
MDVGEMITIRPNLSILEQHLAAEVGEDVNYVAMIKASHRRAIILLYLGKAGYSIELVDSDGFTRAMSRVKSSVLNPYGLTTIDLFEGPPANILCHTVKDL